MHKVVVGTLHRIELGVRVAIHWDNIKNGNIVGEGFVKAELDIGVERLIVVEVEEVLHGVHHSIGAAAAYTGNGFLERFAKLLLKNLLYCYNAGLLLPAAVVVTIKADMNKVSQC